VPLPRVSIVNLLYSTKKAGLAAYEQSVTADSARKIRKSPSKCCSSSVDGLRRISKLGMIRTSAGKSALPGDQTVGNYGALLRSAPDSHSCHRRPPSRRARAFCRNPPECRPGSSRRRWRGGSRTSYWGQLGDNAGRRVGRGRYQAGFRAADRRFRMPKGSFPLPPPFPSLVQFAVWQLSPCRPARGECFLPVQEHNRASLFALVAVVTGF
jgi:hypothetical protein